MKHAGWLIGISCVVGMVSAGSKAFSQPANQVAQHPESQWSTIQTYCFGCHNEYVKAGNLFLNQLSAESVPKHPEIFEKAVRKLRGRQMPPPGTPQPSQQEVDALVGWLESTLDESSKTHLAGNVPVQRLNRTEYANAVQDLLAVVIDRKEVLRVKIGGDADRAFVDRGGGAPAGEKLMERFANIPVQVTAGVHEVVVTFIERSRVETDDLIAGGTQYHGRLIKGYLRLPRVVGPIHVVGPYAATGPTRTPSREKVFICKPEV